MQGGQIVQSFLGVDVSKAKLDVALLLANDKFKSKVFANDVRGVEALIAWLHGHLYLAPPAARCARLLHHRALLRGEDGLVRR